MASPSWLLASLLAMAAANGESLCSSAYEQASEEVSLIQTSVRLHTKPAGQLPHHEQKQADMEQDHGKMAALKQQPLVRPSKMRQMLRQEAAALDKALANLEAKADKHAREQDKARRAELERVDAAVDLKRLQDKHAREQDKAHRAELE